MDRRLTPLTLDLRSLALFRLLLGLLLVADFLGRLSTLGAFYSDDGLLPRSLLLDSGLLTGPSLALVGGGRGFAALLMLTGAALSLAFAFGYRSRLSGMLAWLLLVSVQARNPLVQLEADHLLALWLFALLLLPLGARWSADAALSTLPPPTDPLHRSLPGRLLLLSVLALPPLALLLGPGLSPWPAPSGFYPTSPLPLASRALGTLLAGAPELAAAVGWGLGVAAVLAPVLAFSPWRTDALRLVAIGLLATAQFVVLLTLEAGLLPWITLASLALLPGPVLWHRLSPKPPSGKPLRIYYDQDCGFCRRSCLLLREGLILPPGTTIEPAQAHARPRALMEAQWSWVVIDHHDIAHLKWSAMVALVGASRWLGWSHRLLAWPRWQPIGDRVYDFVAAHRGRIAALTAPWMRERADPFTAGPALRFGGAILLAAALLLPLAERLALPRSSSLTPELARIGLLLPLPPRPAEAARWVHAGRLEDGPWIDLYRDRREAPRYEAPAGQARGPAPRRWQQYFERISASEDPALRDAWGHYACRQAPLVELRIERVRSGIGRGVERQLIWRRECNSPPAAAPLLGEDPLP